MTASHEKNNNNTIALEMTAEQNICNIRVKISLADAAGAFCCLALAGFFFEGKPLTKIVVLIDELS